MEIDSPPNPQNSFKIESTLILRELNKSRQHQAWTKLPYGYFKVNIDGSHYLNNDRSVYRGILRDHTGRFLYVFLRKLVSSI